MTEDPFAAMAAGWRQMMELYQRAWSDALGMASADPAAALRALTTAYEEMSGITRTAEAAAAADLAGQPRLGEELAAAAVRIDALATRLGSIESFLLGLASEPPASEKAKKHGDRKNGKKRDKKKHQ